MPYEDEEIRLLFLSKIPLKGEAMMGKEKPRRFLAPLARFLSDFDRSVFVNDDLIAGFHGV